ncbi:MAG: DUF6562 domain-containing protein [Muribaculaceae bacterium]
MKKLFFFSALAAMALLGSTSCSNDEFEAGEGQAKVNFAVNVESGLESRTISDGTQADKLVYAVFDNNGTRVSGIQKVEKTNVSFPTNETLTLAKGQTYKIVFWAQDADCSAYTVDDNMNLAVDYSGANNDESRDAFYASVSYFVEGDGSMNVVLKRPFAQINVGENKADFDAAKAAGLEIVNSSVKVTSAANAMNLLDGTVSGETSFEYTIATVPAEDLTVEGTAYKYLSMSYILVNDATTGAAKATTGVEYTLATNDGRNITLANGLENIPVQRNYRTNILGSFLTGNVTFTITIDPIYDGEYTNWDGNVQPATVNAAGEYEVATPAQLAWVAQQVNTGVTTFKDKTVKLTSDIDLFGAKWTAIGGLVSYPGITFAGTFDGQNHVIANMSVGDSTPNYAVAGLFGSTIGTIKNVTLKNVDVKSTHYAAAICAYNSVAEVVIENCHVDGGVIASSPELVSGSWDNGDKVGGIMGYTVTGSQIKNCSVKNVEIRAYRDLGGIAGYFDGTVTDCSVDNVTLVQDNTNGYKDAAQTTVGAVVGRPVNDGDFASAVTKLVAGTVADAQNIKNALANTVSNTISLTLGADVTFEGGHLVVPTDKELDLNLNGNTLTIAEDKVIGSAYGKLKVSNGKLVASASNIAVSNVQVQQTSEVEFDNVEINTNASGFLVTESGKLTVKNCTVNARCWGVGTNASSAEQNVNIALENTTVNCSNPVIINVPGSLSLTGCKINGSDHCVILRGGNTTIKDSELVVDYADTDADEMVNKYENGNWGSGNAVPVAALTLGNRAANAYQYPTVANVENTKFSVVGDNAAKFPVVYAYANSGDGKGVTFTYDAACTFTGSERGLIYGSSNITVNGEAVTVTNE